MSSELEPPSGPMPAGFAVASVAETCKAPFPAARPRFYPAYGPSVIGDAVRAATADA